MECEKCGLVQRPVSVTPDLVPKLPSVLIQWRLMASCGTLLKRHVRAMDGRYRERSGLGRDVARSAATDPKETPGGRV